MMTLPFWLSTEQAFRLKAALEAEGFEKVSIGKGPFGGEIVVTAYDGGKDFNVRAGNPMDPEVVIPRFLKWREQRNG